MNTTFLNSADKGDQVICLHSSMSSSRQWEGLMKRLQHSYRVTALVVEQPRIDGYSNPWLFDH